MVGGCDSGYSCAYSNTLSWSSPTTPAALREQPEPCVSRGCSATATPPIRRCARFARGQNRSLLDFVRDGRGAPAHRLSAPATGASSATTSTRCARWSAAIRNARYDGVDLPVLDRPDGIPPTFEEHVRLMSDLVTIAFQADLTRVVTLMYSREGGNRTYRSIGVPDAHHGLSHHQNDPEKMARLAMIDRHHVAMFAYLLEKLRAAAGRQRLAARPLDGRLRQQPERLERPHARRPADAAGRRRQRRAARRASPAVRRRHADDEPVSDHARPPRACIGSRSATARAGSRT